MKRILLRVLVLIIAAGFLIMPTLASLVTDEVTTGPDPVRISDYQVDYTVSANGTLVAKETLTTEFPPGRHGIFRFWDLADPADPHVRLKPQDIAVELDGAKVPFDLSWQQGRRIRVAKIGDPDSTVAAGSHTYTIRYAIKGALSPSNVGTGTFGSSSWTDEQPAESVFYWNVVPQGWSMTIDHAVARVTLPAASGQAQCTTGVEGTGLGATDKCEISGAGTDTVTLSTGELAPNTPMTVRVGLPIRTPDRATVPWPVQFDRALGTSVVNLAVIVAITIVLAMIGYLLDRRAWEEKPGYPVTFEPPSGLGPVQTAYLTTETAPGRGLVATLLHQAEQGLITLTDNGDKSWTVTGIGDEAAWAKTDDVTRFVGTQLGVTTPGAVFESSRDSIKSGEQLQAVRNAIPDQVSTWATNIGAQKIASSENIARVLTALSLVALLGIGIFLHPAASMYLLPLAGFAFGGAGLFTAGVGKRRTPLGRELWSRAGGFERMLSTNSAQDRFDFSGKNDLYTAYIPYAVAFDCADRWARKYELTTGAPAPMPIWYGGGASTGSSAGFMGGHDAFSGFESSLASSISAYAATQSSSSSSGGSGGGGGGGGGGSW